MNKVRGGTVMVVLLFLVMSLAGLLGYGAFRLHVECRGLKDQLDAANQKMDLLQTRYSEKRLEAGEFQRLKLALEGRQRALIEENEQYARRCEALAGEVFRLQTGLEEGRQAAERLRDELKDLQTQLQTTGMVFGQVVTDFSRDLSRLSAEKDTLENGLHQAKIGIEHCEKNNAQLCMLADEVVQRYRDKGVLGVFAEREPLTQLKQVELEELLQTYAEKISRLRLEK